MNTVASGLLKQFQDSLAMLFSLNSWTVSKQFCPNWFKGVGENVAQV